MWMEDLRNVHRGTPLKLFWIVLAMLELNDLRIQALRASYGAGPTWSPAAAAHSTLLISLAAAGLAQQPVAATATDAYGRLDDDRPAQGAAAPACGAEEAASLLSRVAIRAAPRPRAVLLR